jgi:alpha-amylase
VAFGRYLETRQRVRPGHLLSHFLSSHDVEGALSLLGGDRARFRLAAALQLTTSGIPTIYYGEEVAREIGKWPANRSDMPWGERGVRPGAGLPRDEGMRAWYQRLVALRRAHPALSRGTHQTVFAEGDLLAYLRREAASRDAVLVAVNRGEVAASAKIALPPDWTGRVVRDRLGAAAVEVLEGAVSLTVPPLGAAVLAADGPP